MSRARARWIDPPPKRRLAAGGSPIERRLQRLEEALALALPPRPAPEAAFLAALTVDELVELEAIHERAEAGEEPSTADQLRVIELRAAGERRLLEESALSPPLPLPPLGGAR